MAKPLQKLMPAGTEDHRDGSFIWKKKGGHGGAKQIDAVVKKFLAAGFTRQAVNQGNSPDGSYVSTGRVYVDAAGNRLETHDSYGVVAAENYFRMELRLAPKTEQRLQQVLNDLRLLEAAGATFEVAVQDKIFKSRPDQRIATGCALVITPSRAGASLDDTARAQVTKDFDRLLATLLKKQSSMGRKGDDEHYWIERQTTIATWKPLTGESRSFGFGLDAAGGVTPATPKEAQALLDELFELVQQGLPKPFYNVQRTAVR